MRLTEHLYKLLVEHLNEHRVVVWYDGERAFGDFMRQFKAPLCRVVSAEASTLVARREADLVYRQMEESAQPAQANASFLIYIPHARAIQDQRTLDPFEVFAQAGAVFGRLDGALHIPLRSRLFEALRHNLFAATFDGATAHQSVSPDNFSVHTTIGDSWQFQRLLHDIAVPKDIILVTPDQVARQRNVVGTLIRPALHFRVNIPPDAQRDVTISRKLQGTQVQL